VRRAKCTPSSTIRLRRQVEVELGHTSQVLQHDRVDLDRIDVVEHLRDRAGRDAAADTENEGAVRTRREQRRERAHDALGGRLEVDADVAVDEEVGLVTHLVEREDVLLALEAVRRDERASIPVEIFGGMECVVAQVEQVFVPARAMDGNQHHERDRSGDEPARP
jgi:hypothetical protein